MLMFKLISIIKQVLSNLHFNWQVIETFKSSQSTFISSSRDVLFSFLNRTHLKIFLRENHNIDQVV